MAATGRPGRRFDEATRVFGSGRGWRATVEKLAGRGLPRVPPRRRWTPTPLQLGGFLILLGFGGFFCYHGVTGLAAGIGERRELAESRHWPTTTGWIAASDIDLVRGWKSWGVRSGIKGWEVAVAYDYEVAGRSYRGDRIYSGGARFGRYEDDDAYRVFSRYPVGQTVLVAYDPEDPSLALLEPGGRKRHWLFPAGVGSFLLLVGLPFLGFGVWCWWVGPDPVPEALVA